MGVGRRELVLIARLGLRTYTGARTSSGTHQDLIATSDLAQSSFVAVPTYRLETFGKLELSGGASASLSHQKRRLALLAILAASGERGVSRDQLLGYLWPESSASNARHSLDQLLHAMRRTLGETIFSSTNPVRLDFGVVTSDVHEFERALADAALDDAVALYRGPFLHGFYLDDAAEFERWTSAERARLAERYVDASTKLAADAESASDYQAAVRWRRRLVEADPLSSRSALALMRALVAAGDVTAALQHARIYETLVQQELGSAPDPSIAKYAAMLRAGGEAAASVSAPAPSGQTTARSQVSQNNVADVTVGESNIAEASSSTLSVSEPQVDQETVRQTPVVEQVRAGRPNYWWPVGIVLGVLGVFLIVFLGNRRERFPAADANRIVIVPFRTSGTDSSVKYLGEGVVDLIAPMLTGEGGPIAVDSRTAISAWNRITHGRDGTLDDARRVARELGAGLVLSGAVVEVGGKLTITATLIPARGGDARNLTSVSAPANSIDKLLDQLVGQLLARESGVAETSLGAVTSQSLPAIRAYLNGRAAYRRADEEKAIESFTQALDIDSTFALAALDLTIATGRLMRIKLCQLQTCRVFSVVPGFPYSPRIDDLFNRSVRLAWTSRSKLGRRDRPLLDALRGNKYPRETSARETLDAFYRAVAAAPDRPETHYLLGLLLLYQGAALGLPDARVRAAAAFRVASELDSSYLAPLARMVDVTAFARDTAALRSAGASYLSRDTSGPTADYVRWVIAAGTRDVLAQEAVRRRFRSLSRGTLEQIFMTSQMGGLALDDADSATTILAETATDPLDKSVALRRGQLLALNRGRPSAASDFLRRADQLRPPGSTMQGFNITAAMFSDGDRASAASSAKDLEVILARDTLRSLSADAVRGNSPPMAALSLWYLDNGDTVRSAVASDWVRRHSEGQPRNRVLSVLPEMLIASRARRSEGAVLRAFVDSITLNGCCELPEFVISVLARSYEASGDMSAALRVVGRGVWYYPPRQLSTLLREEGRLAAQLGDRNRAIRAYEHYLALRSDPEPALRPQRDSIRAELERLKGVH